MSIFSAILKISKILLICFFFTFTLAFYIYAIEYDESAEITEVLKAYDDFQLLGEIGFRAEHCPPIQRKSIILELLLGDSSGAKKINWKDFYSKQSCSSLFDISPLTIFSKAVDSEVSPICTASILKASQNKNPNYSIAEHTQYVQKYYDELDLCAQGSSAMRDGEGYAPQSRKESGMTLATKDQKRKYMKDIKKLINTFADECCRSDTKCKKIVKETEVSWCKPQANRHKSDKCVDGAFFQHKDKDWENLYDYLTSKDTPRDFRKFPIASGRIVISPYMTSKASGPSGTADFYDSLSDFTHEMGHACSDAKRRIQITKADSHSAKVFHDYERHTSSDSETSCKLTPNSNKTYEELFKNMGANEDTTKCLIKLAQNAENKRFEGGKCEGGCPGSYLEESYADGFKLLHTPARVYISEILPGEAKRVRDSEHPLACDELSCFMMSDKFKNKIEGELGCGK